MPNSGLVRTENEGASLFMDGKSIFKFAIKRIPRDVISLLQKNNKTVDDVKYFIFHQANKYMLEEIQKFLKVKDEQMIIDLENYGNTVSSTIPIAYKNLLERATLTKGDLLIFCGFGVGLSYGTLLYKFI